MVASTLLRLLLPARTEHRIYGIAEVLVFAAGATLATFWVPTALGSAGFVVVGVPVAAVAALWVMPHGFRRLRIAAGAALVIAYSGWLFVAALTASVLAWSVPSWTWVLVVVLTAIAVVGAMVPRGHLRIPLILPVGIAVASFASGWMREDGVIRCDDYLRVRASGLSVPVPSTPELEKCAPGESLMVTRYPRQFWESPDGSSFVLTTQRGDHDYSPRERRGRIVAESFKGAICRARVRSYESPRCFGDGKAHGIAESRLRDRLYIGAHTADGGTVYALAQSGAFEPILEAQMKAKAGLLYLDDEKDIVGLFEDYGLHVYRFRASDLAPLDSMPAPFLPDASHYDQKSHEGIACAAIGPVRRIDGEAYAAVAFNGEPFTFRPLAPSSRYPSSWLAMTWGCDWDPTTRRAYVAIASLGLLEEIDYDSGQILRRSFPGFGIRTLAIDAARRRIYAGFFLSGDVIAIDLDSRAIVDRWPAGRFVRYLALSRDRSSLLVTSNLGIVRIPLPDREAR